MSNYKKGIDVSEHNGMIDWGKVKASGIEFAMLRAGYGMTVDKQFKRNAAECNRLGIPIGVYWFSYAISAAGSAAEAAVCLETIKDYNIEFPVAFDLEYDTVSHAQKNGVFIGVKLSSEMARSFLSAIKKSGNTPINYANQDYLRRYFDETVQNDFPLWLAQWPGGTPSLENPPRPCAIWQYSDHGSVPGIKGPVDLDVCYVDYLKKEQEEPKEVKVYKTLADVPDYYKAAVERVIERGGLKGTGGGLNITDDMCRVFTALYRMGTI